MKKAYIFMISFFTLITLFSLGYYFSYKSSINTKNNNINYAEITPNVVVDNNPITTQNPPVEEVDSLKLAVISPSTNFKLETYDIKNNKVVEEKLNIPDYLVGLKRDEVVTYLSNYMKSLPLNEQQDGLVSYELISFSDSQIILRKTYNEDSVPYKYFIGVVEGEVVVYYSDKNTVYEYTGILSCNLSEDSQIKLNSGIYVKDQEELYGILESYTS